MSMGNDLVTVAALIKIVETEKAIGFIHLDEESQVDKPEWLKAQRAEFWIPKSQIDRNTTEKKGDIGEIDIPRWLAEKNNLDYVG